MRVRVLLTGCVAAAASIGVIGTATADSQLADAAMNGDASAVRALVRQSADIGAAQADGMTALHWAAYLDDIEMADALLSAGADFGASNRTGATPLFLATVNGSAEMLERLIDAGADANSVLTGQLETVLMLTAQTGNPEAVRLLLERGADPNARQARNFSALMFAAAEGHADVIEVLLEHGADPSATTLPAAESERRPAGGMAAMLLAARQGHIDAVGALIDGGADVNQTSADGTGPLLIALLNGHYDLAYLLLEHRADPSVPDVNGRAPLFAAIDLRNQQWAQGPAPVLPQAEHLEMIEALVAAGADVSAQLGGKIPHRGSFDMRWSELEGATPFLRAAWNGDVEVMNLLLELGADPNVVTAKRETALLLLAGAGWPLGQGYLRPDEEILASLDLLVEDLGMDVNAATTEGITPVICAIFKGTNDVIRYLVAHGARLDVRDNEGRSVITWAEGIAANTGQPPRPQPESEALVRELLEQQGITISMLAE